MAQHRITVATLTIGILTLDRRTIDILNMDILNIAGGGDSRLTGAILHTAMLNYGHTYYGYARLGLGLDAGLLWRYLLWLY